MKSHFHMKRWAPDLALRKRLKVIRKWPIDVNGFLGPLSIMAEVCKTSGFGSLFGQEAGTK